MRGRITRAQRLAAIAFVLAAILAAPARAGVYYEAVTRGETRQERLEVHGWVDGEKAKVEFLASGNPLMPTGSYLVTPDGGKTLFLIDPEKKTYSRWDLDAMMRTAGAAMEAMGPMLNLEISDPRVEKLGEEDGGTLVGLPTTHYRYRTTYEMQMKIMGIKRASRVEMEQEIWATDAVVEPGFGVWLRKERATGNETLDKLVKAEMGKISGFPLKTVTVTTTTSGKGKQQQTRSETVVILLDRERSVPASTFEIPSDYQETQMLPMMPEGGEGGGNPFKMLGRKGG